MKRVPNNSVIDKFLEGHDGYRSNNLVSSDGVLTNYSTDIAKWADGVVVLNGRYYSSTTTRHQNRIRRSSNFVIECSSEFLFKELSNDADSVMDLVSWMKKRKLSNVILS